MRRIIKYSGIMYDTVRPSAVSESVALKAVVLPRLIRPRRPDIKVIRIRALRGMRSLR